jgi:hypothetical protein
MRNLPETPIITNAMRVVTQVALTGTRVVTLDFGRKSKLKFFIVT